MATRRYIQITKRSAELSSTFGLEWATKLFGAEALADLPRFLAGPRKGSLKSYVVWEVAAESGYCREYCTPAREGQLLRAHISANAYAQGTLEGRWLGRIQNLSGPPSSMFEEGRAKNAEERRREANRRDAERKALAQ